jgi:hypothetical protein
LYTKIGNNTPNDHPITMYLPNNYKIYQKRERYKKLNPKAFKNIPKTFFGMKIKPSGNPAVGSGWTLEIRLFSPRDKKP